MSQISPQDDRVKKARERVIQLAREIEQLSGDNIPPETFFSEFLTRVVQAIGARAGAVWLLQESGQLNLAAELALESTGLGQQAGSMQANEKLLVEVLQTGEARTLSVRDSADRHLPTEHVQVLSALHKGKDCVGVVQLFQRTDVPEEARSGYMQFLEQMCGYASRYLEGKRRNHAENVDLKNKFWTNFEQFMLRIQRSLDEHEVSDAAASDGRPLLGCDRLSVALRKGANVRIQSVSGQASVNPRANLIRAMRNLAKPVIKMGEPLIYTGRIDGLAPQIEKPLADFIQESGSRMVMLIPMFENRPMVRDQDEDENRKRRRKPKPSGCLVIEQVAESEPAPQLEQRAELLADHVGAAIWNARTHGRIFGRRLWMLMGRSLEWFKGRKLAITTAILAVIVGTGAAMYYIPMDYPVDAEGKLMPVQQRAVFAQFDGDIVEIRFKGGVRVKAGDELIIMKSHALDEEIAQAEASMTKYEEQYRILQGNIREAAGDDYTEARLNFITQQTDALYNYYEAKRRKEELEARKQERLIITAPISGVIPDFQVEQLLEQRPVRAGDHLFDIMEDEQKWHLELLVEEKRLGHIQRALSALREKDPDGTLTGEFSLATQPDQQFDCHLSDIASRSATDQELGTVVEIFCDPENQDELPSRRIGSEVTVRLYCGKRSLGYRLFGDVVEFAQKYFWL